MPTYEYVCHKCNHQFDLYQPISDNALTVCPREHCGQRTWGKGRVQRQIGAGAGLIFKGSGFYITDYRSKEYKESAKKEAPATTSTSTENKPAATPATPAKTESKPAKKETSTKS